MRKTFIAISLLALLACTAVSCQKENLIDETNIVAGNYTVYNVSYTVDGKKCQISLIGEDAWHSFLHRMLALAEEGHVVSFRNEETSSCVRSAKETVTYTTTDGDDAINWAEKMSDKGYAVTIKYDKKNGIYICEATK